MKVDYTKGKIYKITNDYNDHVYIGSSCDTLTKVFSKHKSESTSQYKMNRPLYKLINDIGFERFRIELICVYPCEDKYQLCQKTSEFIRQHDKTLNLHGDDHKKERKHQKEERQRETELKIKEDLEKRMTKFKDKNSTILCDCGCEILKTGLNAHQKTKKHIEYLQIQNKSQ